DDPVPRKLVAQHSGRGHQSVRTEDISRGRGRDGPPRRQTGDGMSCDELIALVEQARASDMLRLAAAHGARLTRYGHSGEFVGACPVCGTGRDRFAINPKKGFFNCRVCGKGGHGPIDLEIFLGGCDFVEAVKRLTNTTTLSDKRLPTAHNAEAA